jgi:2-hydroxy-3-oxopropionate reductase
MTTVGFIGLGVMGRPMVRNLLTNNFEVVVHNRSQDPVEQLVNEGATAARGPGDLAQRCDVVITMLPHSAAVEEVVLGPDGVLTHAKPGSIIVDMSTVDPATSRLIAEQSSERGVSAVDAPVSGGERGATQGTLSIMVGGSEEAFTQVRDVLATMGTTIVHVGPSGAGQTTKAANQLLVAGIIELVGEALILLERSGLDPKPAVEVLAGGLAGNRILDEKADGMLAREFTPGARVDLHHKDLGIVLDLARQHDVFLPVTGLVAQLMSALRATGRGSLDHSALMLVIDELSGRGTQDT